MSKAIRFILIIIMTQTVYADTIERYMNIVDSIPKMEMKADTEAQVWVRSARNVVTLTCESIAETLMFTNQAAVANHKPLFCLPSDVTLDAAFLNNLIQETYRNMPTPSDVKDKMSVSEVALLGVTHKFPCHQAISPTHLTSSLKSSGEMLHVSGLTTDAAKP